MTALGNWLDLGSERRVHDSKVTEGGDGSTNRKRRVRRQNKLGWGGGRWFIPFCACGILDAGELPVSHLCSVPFITPDTTIPDPLCASSFSIKHLAAFYSLAE